MASEIRDSNGNVIEEIQPTVAKKTISKETSDIMRDYLRGVVQEGTGKTAGVDGYDIGGKTGTAEKVPRGTGNYLVSFIGFAPVDDPQVVVYTIIDEPNDPSQPHSTYAQEIEHAIFEQLLPYMNIEKSADAGQSTDAAADPNAQTTVNGNVLTQAGE